VQHELRPEEHFIDMAWRLRRPLIPVSCHDDLTASDLMGRFLVKGGETISPI
jgi:hypothetical protein